MYLYKDAKSRFWQAEIWIEGQQHRRSTKCTTRREAEAAARQIEADLIEQHKAETAAGASLALKDVGARYMLHVGDHHAGADNTERLVALLLKFFGPDKLVPDITHDDALRLRTWRRKQETGPKDARRPISNATVNDTVEQLKKLCTFVKAARVQLPHEPKWVDLWLEEAEPTPRELSTAETARLIKALNETREDYQPVFEFAWLSLKRKTEIYTLLWSHVKWDHGIIERPGKRDKLVRVDITDDIREILWPLYQRRHDHCGVPEAADYVFTFTAERTIDKTIRGKRHHFVKGKRYPISRDGLRRVWDDLRTRARLTGSDNFRFHDLRHDGATKVLRAKGNLKLVAKLLDHGNTVTVSKTYAHIMRDDTAAALADLAAARKAADKHPRKNPRSRALKAV
jgi:integrase